MLLPAYRRFFTSHVIRLSALWFYTSRMNADYYVHVYLVGGEKKSLKEHDSKLIIV